MKNFVLLILFIALAGLLAGAASNYSFSYSAGTYTEITGGTVWPIAAGANDVALNFPLPWGFTYDGVSYLNARISDNGWLIFYNGAAPTATTSSNVINGTGITKALVPLWDALYVGLAAPFAEIRYETLGTLPNRTFVVQWKDIRWAGNPGTPQNFQIRLEEGTNVINFVYGSMPTPANGPSASIGIIDATGGTNHYLSITPGAPPTVSSTVANNSIADVTYLTSGTTYTFTPPVPVAPPNLAGIVSPLNNAINVMANSTLNWTDSGGWTTGFKLYFGTDNPPPLVGDLGYVTSYDPTGDMVFSALHYWKVVPYNSFGDNNAAPLWSFTTADAPHAGIKTIGGGGDFATFTAAINSLNIVGVGSGGVTYQVANGTYNENPPAITATGTETNPIRFEAALGANPVLTPTGGTGTFGFKLNGSDYVTFDNIDISAPANLTYGYWLSGLAGNGASYNAVLNSSITYVSGTTVTYAIYSLGALNGANSNSTFQGNTITSSYNGIYQTGSTTTGNESLNGVIQNNTISNIRNYGIYNGYAINSLIQGNSVGFYSGGTTYYYGIYSIGANNTATVQNNTISGGYTSSNIYGLYNASGTALYYNNLVTGLHSTGFSFYGMYGTGAVDFYKNTISDINNIGTGYVYGAYNVGGTNYTYRENTITGISGGSIVWGIMVSGGTTINVYDNKISGLTTTGTSSGYVYGISLISGNPVNVYNNMVYDLNNVNGTNTPQIRGISFSATLTNLWNNTVYLNASGTSANYSTAALSAGSYSAFELKNNIVINESTPGAAGKTVAFLLTYGGISYLTAESDRNIYYAGVPDAQHLIASYDYGTVINSITLADYQTYASPREQGSFTENVPFVSSSAPIDLHIDPLIPTKVESNGLMIAAVTTDIDGDLRHVTTPDIGSDEGDFTSVLGIPGNVLLVTPTDGAIELDPNSLIVTWNDLVTGGVPTYYRVYVATTAGGILAGYFADVAYPGTSLDLNTVSGLTLGNANTWFWAVQPFNANGGSDTAAPSFLIYSFTTSHLIPLAAINPVPADLAIDVAIDSALSWDTVIDAASYDVYFGIALPALPNVNVLVPTWTPPLMDNLTVYQWKVVPKNVAGEALACPTWSFTTIQGVPLAAVNPVPADLAYDVAIDAALSWDSVAGADSYDVYFGINWPLDLGGNVLTPTWTPPLMENNTVYQWMVVPKNEVGEAIEIPVWLFVTIMPLPLAAVNPVPADLAIDVPIDAVLSWDASFDADSYDVYFGTTLPALPNANVLDPTWTPPLMDNATTYVWKIVPVNYVGEAINCPTWTFTTIVGLPLAAVNPVPADEAIDVAIDATLSWDPVDTATSYDVYFGATLPALPNANVLLPIWTPPTMTNNTLYVWKVVPMNAAGEALACPTWSFTTIALAVLPAPLNLTVQISGADMILNWDAVTGATGYIIYAADTPYAPVGNWTQIGTSGTTSFIDAAVSGPMRFYMVTAIN